MHKLTNLIICLSLITSSFADTFTSKKTGETFNGYVTMKKNGKGETLVCLESNKKPQYFNLIDYEIKQNYLGRKNNVIVLPVQNKIELECETEAFEKAIGIASNQGPLFIVVQIDTPGGQTRLMNRICDAIIKTNNCKTVAFISGGKYGGAYSAGALIALACDSIIMSNETAIGAATAIKGGKDMKSFYGETIGEKYISADRAQIAAIAEKSGRSGILVKAMVDKEIEVLEVVDQNDITFIEPINKKESQSVKHIWSKKGSLLTLTAKEAAECGIADGLANSLPDVFSYWNLEKVSIITDKNIPKAIRKFKTKKRRLDNIYKKIDLYKKKTGESVGPN